MQLKRILLASVAALAIATAAAASYLDFEQIAIDATAGGKSLTSTKITPAGQPVMTYAVCQVETAQVRWSWADPAKITVTSSVGNLQNPGDFIYLVTREQLLNFRAIRATATSAQVNCHYVAVP